MRHQNHTIEFCQVPPSPVPSTLMFQGGETDPKGILIPVENQKISKNVDGNVRQAVIVRQRQGNRDTIMPLQIQKNVIMPPCLTEIG